MTMNSKSIISYAMTFILATMAIPYVHGQKANNLELVKNIYDALQNNSTTLKDIVAMNPTLNWEEVETPEVTEESK